MSAEHTPSAGFTVSDEVTRVKIFIWIQMFFLVVSIFTGGFHFKLWSMLDTALLIQSIGITGLILVLDQAKLRHFAFMTAIVFYLSALLDMGINVLVSGVVGWHAISDQIIARSSSRKSNHMKIAKIVLGSVAALWALALIPKLFVGLSHSGGPFAFSHVMGSVVGILIASAISITLFRSAFAK